MTLRRAGMLVLVLALSACDTATQVAMPPELVFATFNSATSTIPLPNDLVLQNAAAVTPAAQSEVLKGYIMSGGWPSDVEVPISLPFHAVTWDANSGTAGAYVPAAAPMLDAASVTPQTVTLLRADTSPPTPVAYEAVITAGKLTLRKPAASATDLSRRWPGGRYVVAVRGGPSGVKTTTGLPVAADGAIALVIPNKDLSKAENQPIGGLSPATAAQANGLRTILWNPLNWQASATGSWSPVPSATVTPAFLAIDTVFPHQESAVVATFGIDRSAHVALDSAAGQIPFPSDFLLELNPANCPTGVAPCIKDNPAFGPAAAGLRTLDGFSTTALLLAPLTGLVDATTINRNSVHLFELPAGANPIWLKDLASSLPSGTGAAYLTQPPGTTSGGFANTLVLAPAVRADLSSLGAGKYFLPPLKEKTRYAVVVTKRVLNQAGTPLTRGAVGNILLSTTAALWGPDPRDPDCAVPSDPLCSKIPYILGPDLPTTQGLQALRDGLQPFLTTALPALTGGLTSKDDVSMIYTVSTQTVTTPSTASLAFAAGALPTAATFLTPATVGAQYGVDAAAAFPGGVVSEFAEVTFDTQNLLLSGQTQGMFDTAHPTVEHLVALVALPNPALVTGACPAGFPATAKCAPLVVFRHGLPRAKGDMLPIATMLASKGFIVAAIDAEKHGDRTYCGGADQATADLQCFNPAGAPASTCVADPKLKTSVDTGIVGRCDSGLLRKRVDCADADVFLPSGAFNSACYAPKGIPLASGQYIISSNFFRSRDTFRQDVIDQAALVNALAPTAPPTAGADAFYDHLAGLNRAVHPDQVYFASLSFGSTNAALSVAVNPRFKMGAFQSGFATITDAFFNPESKYYATAAALLASFTPPVLPGTAQWTQFQQVAKWILDPADAANYGAMIKASSKPVLSQIGLCDGTVPSVQSEYFTAMLGLPVPAPSLADTSTGYTQWFSGSTTTLACPAAAVDHGWLITPSTGTLMTQAQASFAEFLTTGAAQPTTVKP
jgi:hypothetical protein